MDSPRLVRLGFSLLAGGAILQGLAILVSLNEVLGVSATILIGLLCLPEKTPEWIRLALSVALLAVVASVVLWLIASRSDPRLGMDDWLAEKRIRLLGVWAFSAVLVFAYKTGIEDARADRFR